MAAPPAPRVQRAPRVCCAPSASAASGRTGGGAPAHWPSTAPPPPAALPPLPRGAPLPASSRPRFPCLKMKTRPQAGLCKEQVQYQFAPRFCRQDLPKGGNTPGTKPAPPPRTGRVNGSQPARSRTKGCTHPPEGRAQVGSGLTKPSAKSVIEPRVGGTHHAVHLWASVCFSAKRR
jgi:hypothetical protein